MTLNYKGIPYRIEWAEYNDIEGVCHKLGVQAPAGTSFSPYTFPIIYDPKTDKTVIESFQIALYLDETYPDTPRVVPEGKSDSQGEFASSWEKLVNWAAFPLVIGGTYRQLTEANAEALRAKVETPLGCKIEDMDDKERRKPVFAGLKNNFDTIRAQYKGDYFMGEELSFADIAVGAWLRGTELLGNDVYSTVTSWDDGFWAKKAALVQTYNQIV